MKKVLLIFILISLIITVKAQTLKDFLLPSSLDSVYLYTQLYDEDLTLTKDTVYYKCTKVGNNKYEFETRRMSTKAKNNVWIESYTLLINDYVAYIVDYNYSTWFIDKEFCSSKYHSDNPYPADIVYINLPKPKSKIKYTYSYKSEDDYYMEDELTAEIEIEFQRIVDDCLFINIIYESCGGTRYLYRINYGLERTFITKENGKVLQYGLTKRIGSVKNFPPHMTVRLD